MDYSAKVLSEVISEQTHVISNNKGRKMRVAILQIEDRVDPYFEWCFNLNKAYCLKHNIDHIIIRKGPDDLPPYFWKVSVFLDLMNQGKHDIICWMDSDAFVKDIKRDIRVFFNDTSESMVIAPDPPGWGSPFMAAVYMAKNNSIGRQIFTEWIGYYDSTKWTKLEDGKWKHTGNGRWAGTEYEQGSYSINILPKYRNHIKVLPWYVLHETNCSKPHDDNWSIHLPGVIKRLRPQCVVLEQSRRSFIGKINMSVLFIIFTIILLVTIIVLYILYSRKYI